MGVRAARRARVNKGFARRPQKFLGWEVGGRMQRFLHLEVVEWVWRYEVGRYEVGTRYVGM